MLSLESTWSACTCLSNRCRTDFLAGQLFDIRLEVHAPVNGSEATGNPNPDTNFAFTIARQGRRPQSASSYFKVEEPALERWNFTWYEGKISSSPHYHFAVDTLRNRSLCPRCQECIARQRCCEGLPTCSPLSSRRIHGHLDVQQWSDDNCIVVGPRPCYGAEDKEHSSLHWRMYHALRYSYMTNPLS